MSLQAKARPAAGMNAVVTKPIDVTQVFEISAAMSCQTAPIKQSDHDVQRA